MNNEYEKEFDWWNAVKKRIDGELSHPQYHREGEVWWCSFGVNIGVEIDGKQKYFERPAVIVKRFNKYMVWVVPSTSNEIESDFHYFCRTTNDAFNFSISQLRLMSSKRLFRKMDLLEDKDLEAIKLKIISLLKSETPPHDGGESRGPKA